LKIRLNAVLTTGEFSDFLSISPSTRGSLIRTTALPLKYELNKLASRENLINILMISVYIHKVAISRLWTLLSKTTTGKELLIKHIELFGAVSITECMADRGGWRGLV
jgi:hypothetical protein